MTYLVSQEIAYNNDRHDEHHNVEDFKVEVHRLVQTPAHNDHERRIEQCCLYCGAHAVRKSEVHLVVPGLVDG